MKQDKKPSSSDLTLFKKTKIVASFSLIILFALAFAFGVLFFGIAGFFSLFGVSFDSYTVLLFYVLAAFAIGFVLDFFSLFLIALTVQKLGDRFGRFLARLVIDGTMSWLTLYTADELIRGIAVPFATEAATALFLVLFDIATDEKKEERKAS